VEEAESPEAGNADSWSAKAIHDVPPIPFADANWGQSLLERGHPDAVKKGPHFADALEGWGEALMAKRQSHLALAKFARALSGGLSPSEKSEVATLRERLT
jgi:hypothetical protein